MQPLDLKLRIKGKTVYLRPITEEDTDLVVRWRNDKKVVENFIYRKPITRDDHLNWFHNKIEKGLVYQFIICDNETDKPLGSVYLQNFEEDCKKAEFGSFLGEDEAYGRGLGTETCSLLVEYSFEVLGLHKLESRVIAYNVASRRMLEKSGYVQEAYLRDELFLNGKYEDLTFYGIINHR